MAKLKQIKFGQSVNEIAKTIVQPKSGGVIEVTNTGGRKNDKTENDDYSYDIDVNVDGSTIVKSEGKLAVGTVPAAKVSVAEGTGLKATEAQSAFKELKDKINEVEGAAKSYTIVKDDSKLESNVKEQYVLQETVNGVASNVGAPIKIYKDSSLKSVALDGQVLNFTYILADGTESTVGVDVSTFLAESEFADGLFVDNHVVKVKVDASSESFLTVGEAGVKLSGVQNAINAAVNTAVEALDATVGSTTVEDGKHVAVQVVETDGKLTALTVTESDVASKTALDAEIAARKAVDGQTGQTYAANDGTNYISGATSLNDADVKLDAELKKEADRAKAAEEAEVTRAQKAEKEIADKVGLTGVEGSRTFNPTSNYGGESATVMANMQAIDTKLQAVDTKLQEVEVAAKAIQYQVSGTTLEFFGINPKA